MSVWGRSRRRRPRTRAAAKEDPCDMDCGTGVDSIDRLARKYMRKCTVDSSTESESDIHSEFPDPYDGDSEETSTHSDCSLSGTQPPQASSEVCAWTSKIQRCSVFEDPSSKKVMNWVSPMLVANDVFMQPVDLEMPLESPNKGLWQCSVEGVQPSEFSMDSGVISNGPHLHSGQFVLIGINPGRPTQHLDGGVKAALPLTNLTSSSCGRSILPKQLVEKRKQGSTMLESGGEKMKRKKQRVTEMKLDTLQSPFD
ncbi:uncharacterized protein [Ambystoma mexicanum]|uniref:uncharacterized protein isoform X2 n=1 Tax=Ambystoma mexicanum TaxID=8296 RepID=UPI0037E9739B